MVTYDVPECPAKPVLPTIQQPGNNYQEMNMIIGHNHQEKLPVSNSFQDNLGRNDQETNLDHAGNIPAPPPDICIRPDGEFMQPDKYIREL